MKKLLFLFVIINMMITTVFGQITLGQQTITFMNCIDCENYYEPEVNTIDMVGLVISADTVNENAGYDEIYSKFYEEFSEDHLPGVFSIFLRPDDIDILYIVIRRDLNDETRAIYLLTWHGWLQSVDMQDFYFFDRLLSLFSYQSGSNQPILIKSEPLR